VIFVLSIPLFLAACVIAREMRAAAALAVGVVCGTLWLWPAYRAWQGHHPGGGPTAFLQVHGLSAALLMLAVTLLAVIWWTGSVLTSRFGCPAGQKWLVLRVLSHLPATALLLVLTTGHSELVPALLAAWSVRPLLCGYLRLIAGVHVHNSRMQLPSWQATGGVALLLCTLALSAALWPAGGLGQLNLTRVVALRGEAAEGYGPAHATR